MGPVQMYCALNILSATGSSFAAVGQTTAALAFVGQTTKARKGVMSSSLIEVSAQITRETCPRVEEDKSMETVREWRYESIWAPFFWFMTVLLGVVAVILGSSLDPYAPIIRGICLILMLLSFLGAVLCTLNWGFKADQVYWYLPAQGVVRLTAQTYPQDAQGLVLELTVRNCRPSLRFLWGPEGWHYFRDWERRMAYFVSLQGARVPASCEDALEQNGLTKKVRSILTASVSHGQWQIKPLNRGRVLRLVELQSNCRHVLDLHPESLAELPWVIDNYYETVCDERLRRLAGLRMRSAEREQLVEFLCAALGQCRIRATSARRLNARIAAYGDLLAVLEILHAVLDLADPRRGKDGSEIGEKPIKALKDELAGLTARLAQAVAHDAAPDSGGGAA